MRAERLDIPGLLQHVMVRGIEKRKIFLDDEDREFFLQRFSKLLGETGTDCLAGVCMSSHIHLLLRPRRQKLGFLMRRLLTGYAIHFTFAIDEMDIFFRIDINPSFAKRTHIYWNWFGTSI